MAGNDGEQAAAAAAAVRLDVLPFVTRLHQLLTAESASDTGRIVEWERNPRPQWPAGAFTVHNNEEFAKQILPKYFKHSNFT
jgi:hypothetical protein